MTNMLLFRGLLYSLTLLFLTACSTSYDVVKNEQEQILSLAQDDNYFYVMGSQHDYRFPRKYTSSLERLVQSPYAGKMTYIEASGRVYNNKNVSGVLTLYMSPNHLSEKQQQQLVADYGFKVIKEINKDNSAWKKPALAAELTKKPELLRRDYRLSEGEFITINNRQQLINNHSLSQPVAINVEYINASNHFSSSDAATVAAAPVLIVAAIPIYLIWGVMCSGNGC